MSRTLPAKCRFWTVTPCMRPSTMSPCINAATNEPTPNATSHARRCLFDCARNSNVTPRNPVMSGIALLFGYAVLGSGWLKLKSNVSLQPFVSRSLRVFAAAFAVFFGIVCIYAVRIQPGIRAQWASHGIALACLVGLFIVAAGTLTALPGTSRPALPFLLGLLLFVVGISGIALIVFPEIVPFSVSLWDASSSSTSQGLVMIGAACVTPVVLAYSAFAYWIFRGKTPENGWEA